MKKLLLFTASLALISGVYAKKVKFSVDMTGKTVGANGVHIAGNFQKAAGAAGDWDPSTTAMTNGGSGNIYSVIVDIPAGNVYEFKFINGNSWSDVESVPALSQKGHTNNGQSNDNRWLYLDSIANDTTFMGSILYSGDAPAGKVAIRFAVDMQKEASVSSNGVHLAGSLQGWDPGKTQMANLYNTNKIYEYIAILDTGSYEYKFVNGNGWNSPNSPENIPSGCSVNGNRGIHATASANVGKVCFASCTACPAAPLPRYYASFIVDMANSDCDGGFDSVTVAGGRTELTNWGEGVKLTKLPSTTFYAKVIQVDSGEMQFKFRFHKNGNTNWEGGDNRVWVISADDTMDINCFGTRSACVAKPAPSNVTFEVDLSNETPDAQGRIYVIGTFQTPNWQAGALRMAPVSGRLGVYSVTVNNVCPGKFNYKFLNGDSSLDASGETFPDTADRACVEPSGVGGFNRVYTRTSTSAVTLSYVFNSCEAPSSGYADIAALNTSISLYPNPMKDYSVVSLSNGSSIESVVITDISGRTIREYKNVNLSAQKIEKENLKGFYFINIKDIQGRVGTTKLVVE